ncbi:DNA damage-inducible protein 1 [Entomophthora muscae]|uniref:DNA damage-inducible protein 1 n=1 Tax=Entomophthora muscae TaxID=34485 RepID=A0ACC2TP45_9FUNG|nr:DNA damage-inducible protein 1 [Entomophthora muscae]
MTSHYPGVIDSLMQFVEASNNPLIHLVNKNSTYSDCMYCDILVKKVKVQAIIDSGALVNIVSTTLVKQLKIAPDVDYCKQYGNAGPVPTVSQGMYSALPLQFRSLAVSSPAIVFPHKDFDILIGTQLMQNFGAKIDFQENVLEILGQKLPIYYMLDGIIPETKRCNYINIAYQDGMIPVQFYQSGKKILMPPTQIEENKGIPLRAYKTYEIKPGDQHILETKLTLKIPEGLYGKIEQPYQRSCLEPSICPGIVIPGHKEIQVLAANLTANTIHVKKGQVIAFLHLLPSEEIARFENFGSLADMGLPDTKPPVCPVIP